MIVAKVDTPFLGPLVKIRTGKLDANASSPNGKYPFFTCAVKTLKIDNYAYDCECVLIAGNGDLNAKYYNGRFNAYQRTYIVESKDKETLTVRYLYYFLDKYIEKLRMGSIGGVIKYIKLSHLTDIKIPLPPITEQKRIADILDKADAIRRKREKAIKLADEFLRSVFLDIFGDPVVNPKGWNLFKFSEVGTLDRGKSKHRPRNALELLGGKYPLIQTGDVANSDGYISNYTQTYSKLGLKQSRIWPAGTLCITIAANIAKTGILTFDACFPDSIVGFTPNNNIQIEYVQFWMSFLQKILEETAPESAQKNINLRILRDLDIPLPNIKLQNQFANIVGKIEMMKSKIKYKLNNSHKLFNSITQRAFRGDLQRMFS